MKYYNLFSDGGFEKTILVQHENALSIFEYEYEAALEKVKQNPEWSIDDVLDRLRANGWAIISVEASDLAF